MINLLTNEEVKTIDYYDKNATQWSSKNTGGVMFDEDMAELFKLVSKGRILEVGAGHGEDAKKIINFYGIDNYIGIEPAFGLFEIAKQNNPGATFINENIYQMDFPADYFDAFWICAMLVHIPKKNLNKVLAKLYLLLKKESYGFMSIMEGSADLVESRPDRYYSLWEQDEFEKALNSTGFKVYRKRRIVRPKGTPWLAYIIQKI